jgi:hypothetical protein
MKIEENIFDLKGGVVKFHPVGYLKKVQSLSLISSLKKRRVVETNVRKTSNIMDSLEDVTHPAASKNQKSFGKNQSFFEHLLRSLNNLIIRDNHFSCNDYNKIVLNVA